MMKMKHEAFITLIQSRHRGNMARQEVQEIRKKKKTKKERMDATGNSWSWDTLPRFILEPSIMKLQAACRAKLAPTFSKLLEFQFYEALKLNNIPEKDEQQKQQRVVSREPSMPMQKDPDDVYLEDEDDDDDTPRWVGREFYFAAVKMQANCRRKLAADYFEVSQEHHRMQRELETLEAANRHRLDEEERLKQPQKRQMLSSSAQVLDVQIDMIEAEWQAATRHKSVLRFATHRLAYSIVLDLIEETVAKQEALKARCDRARMRLEEEKNRGYRKPRIVEAIVELKKKEAEQELEARREFFRQTNSWFRERASSIRWVKKEEEGRIEMETAQKSAEYIAARRAKVDQIYAHREQEKLLNQSKVEALKQQRREESKNLMESLTKHKMLDDARLEQELRAKVALDAQRRRQVTLAHLHNQKLLAEKEKLHQLGNEAARTRVLKEERKSQELMKHVQTLEKKKQKCILERQEKREKIMALYDRAMKQQDEFLNATSKSASSALSGAARDPNETLKFAIGVYFQDPSKSAVLSVTKKMMGDLMFEQGEGKAEWTEKRVEARLKEIFAWMDKDGTGQVEQAELYSALQRMGAKVKASDMAHLLKAIDIDGDGQLTRQEFMDFGKSIFLNHRDVSGNKVLGSSALGSSALGSSRPSTSSTTTRAATPETIEANKRERQSRLDAARHAKQMEEKSKAQTASALLFAYLFQIFWLFVSDIGVYCR
jgi:hypothetical protein